MGAVSVSEGDSVKTLGRKVRFGIVSLLMLLGGLALCLVYDKAGAALFPAYASGVAAVVVAVVAGNVGEHFAKKEPQP